jgi:hypothetical protein
MKKNIIAALFVLAAAAGLHAQQIQAPASTTTESVGLIGKQWINSEFSYYAISHSHKDVYGLASTYNAPVTAGLDAHASYQYDWTAGTPRNHLTQANVGFTAYLDQGVYKPFVTGNLGYIWPQSEDRFVWDGAVGIELALCSKAFAVASVGYSDDFRRHNGDQGSFEGKVGAGYWVTKTVAVTATVSQQEEGSHGFTVGAAWRF